jgi:uncharacterized protein YprB with RNaseH-like and TPR domain
MNSKIFELIEENRKKVLERKSWQELSDEHEEWGYSGGVALRSSWRRESRRREENQLSKKGNEIRIAVFDIENAPLQVYTFQLYDVNIGTEQVISDTFLLSWSAKLLNESKIYGQVLTPEEAKNKDDYRIVKGIWEFLDNCHILIGHNIKNFDLAKLNVRFLFHNLPPISNCQIIDTLLIARSNFSFASNKLSYLNKFLNIKQKIENEGFSLWRRCFEADPEALETMFLYNRGDVVATEDLYYKLRPFIKGHPNLALYFESTDEICPNCGDTDLEENGYYFTPAGKWESVRCTKCGSISRRKVNELKKDKRKKLLVN